MVASQAMGTEGHTLPTQQAWKWHFQPRPFRFILNLVSV